MMGRDESWWQSRTGLEQKLVILSTILFILSFSLTITVIVLKNRTPSSSPTDATTIEPTAVTSEGTPATGETVTEPPETPSSPAPEPTPEPTKEDPSSSVASSAEPAKTTAEPAATTAEPAATTKATVPTVTEGSSTVTEAPVTTTKGKDASEDKVEEKASGPGSINSRPARYIPSPRGLANLHGEMLGA